MDRQWFCLWAQGTIQSTILSSGCPKRLHTSPVIHRFLRRVKWSALDKRAKWWMKKNCRRERPSPINQHQQILYRVLSSKLVVCQFGPSKKKSATQTHKKHNRKNQPNNHNSLITMVRFFVSPSPATSMSNEHHHHHPHPHPRVKNRSSWCFFPSRQKEIIIYDNSDHTRLTQQQQQQTTTNHSLSFFFCFKISHVCV